MEYLEKSLLERNLVELIGEAPTPKRGYGVLTYYYSSNPKKKLLTAAQRRKRYTVVIFNNKIAKEELQRLGFQKGNNRETPDVKMGARKT